MSCLTLTKRPTLMNTHTGLSMLEVRRGRRRAAMARAASEPKYEAAIDWAHYTPRPREELERMLCLSVAEVYWRVISPVRAAELSLSRNEAAFSREHGPFSHVRRAGTLPPPKPARPEGSGKT
eukprot:scaffold38084_cov32-Tisochrysis_lutea.AAC.1